MALDKKDCETIVCRICDSFIKENEIPLPKEVSDYIQTTISQGSAA